MDALKSLFSQGLDYSVSKSGVYFQSKIINDLQNQRVQDAKTYQEFAAAVSIYNYQRQFGYPNEIMDRPPEDNTLQFGQTMYNEITISAFTDAFAFTFKLTKVEIAPPAIVNKLRIRPEDAVLWFATGGYGRNDNDQWFGLPAFWLENHSYEIWSQQTFVFSANDNGRIHEFRLLSVDPMRFDLQIRFQDEEKNTHRLNATLTPAKSPKRVNGQVVYSHMLASVQVNDLPTNQGTGIVKHQAILSASSDFFTQTGYVLGGHPTPYYNPALMIFLVIDDNVFDIEIAQDFFIGSGMSLRGKELTSNQPVELVISKTTTVNRLEIPVKFFIQIGYVQLYAKTDFGFGVSVNSILQDSAELPLTVTDTNGFTGTGTLTYENILPMSDWSVRSIGKDLPIFYQQPIQSTTDALIAATVIVLPVLIAIAIVLAVYFSLRAK